VLWRDFLKCFAQGATANRSFQHADYRLKHPVRFPFFVRILPEGLRFACFNIQYRNRLLKNTSGPP
jgi:hypothetical protein